MGPGDVAAVVLAVRWGQCSARVRLTRDALQLRRQGAPLEAVDLLKKAMLGPWAMFEGTLCKWNWNRFGMSSGAKSRTAALILL